MVNKDSIVLTARKKFHQELVSCGLLSFVGKDGIASNADRTNKPSCAIAKLIGDRLGAKKGCKLSPQKTGKYFESAIFQLVQDTFPKLQHLRPGKWDILRLGNKNAVKTSNFAQYEHLAHLAKVLKSDRTLETMLGNDYIVAPDIVVSRELCDDAEINAGACFVDKNVCLKTDIRKSNGGQPLLHASISAKWTMRSDRSQNSRTEALNLIRNRKGHLPHIVVVTGEPLPSRLASLALGTGDIDCVYHFALYELLDAVKEYGKDGREDIIEQLESLIDGRRLKDISDLPLDLTC